MLTPIFTYTLQDFCDRYRVDMEYVKGVIIQKYPLLKIESTELIVLLSEVDLLVLIGLGLWDDIRDDDPRKEAKVIIYPD